MRHTTILTALAAALSGPVWAAEFDAAATGHDAAENTPMPVAEGVVVIRTLATYTGFDTVDPGNPMAGLSGPCIGTVMVKAGAVSGGGACHYTDGDGDIVMMNWAADGLSAEVRTHGEWSIAGGSGKWAVAAGGGRFDAGTDAAGAYTNAVTGAFTLP
jgi:hypothetical protein